MDTNSCFVFAGFIMLILLLVLIIIKMIRNRVNGRDELDGFF